MMKFLNKIKWLVGALGLIWLSACEEDIDKVLLPTDVVAPVLNATSTDAFVLTEEISAAIFETFSWRAPDYGTDLLVTYTLQLDTAGGNFESPISLGSTTELTLSPTVAVVNAAMLGKGVVAESAKEMQFRVMAVISEEVAPVYSNVVSATITPYETEFEPIYLIGDDQRWNLAAPAILESSSAGLYEATVVFSNGSTFRFFETASWDANQWKWADFDGGSVSELLEGAGDGDDNFRFVGTNGVYQITVNINTKTITMEEGVMPTLFVIGQGQSWDLAQAASLTYKGDNVFEGEAILTQDATFRLFEKADWNATQYGYAYFGGNVPEAFTEAADADDNFYFTGATGTYVITVSLSDKTITYEAASPYPSTLYLVGDDQDWTFANSPVFSSSAEGEFTASGVTFTNGSTFRFFEELDNWSVAYGYSYFTDGGSIDASLADTGDGDSNFRFEGTDGVYDVAVSFVTKTITLSVASAYPSGLYLVGDGQGWDFANSPTFENQGDGVFTAAGVTFTNAETFRFFKESGNWTDDFSFADFTSVDEKLEAVGDGDDNFRFVGETGSYTITVDFSTSTITIVAGAGYPSTIYLVGDGQSWTFGNSPAFATSGDGVYQATGVAFANGETFRFFEEADNWADDISFADFTTVDSNLEAVGDNDDNFKFVGTDGTYSITVDLKNHSVQLTQ